MNANKIILCVVLLLSYRMIAATQRCPYFVYGEAGVSWTPTTDICTNPLFWDPAREGYAASLCHAPMVGLGFGFYVNSWLAFGLSAHHRSHFKYCKHQTPPAGAELTPGFLGDKTRFFDLDNTSFMANLFLSHTFTPRWNNCCYELSWKPYATGGIGWSKNTVYNFHTVPNEQIQAGQLIVNPASSVMTYFVTNRVGYQAELGLGLEVCNDVTISIGYRYFSAGCFFSNNYFVTIPRDFADEATTAPPWSGRLRLHEFVARLGIEF